MVRHRHRTAVLVLCLAALLPAAGAWSVPARPNAAVLEGTVVEYAIVASDRIGVHPGRPLYRLIVAVEHIEDITGIPNFLRDRTGETVTVYSRKELPSGLFGKKVRAIVRYVGDEKGGRFWLHELNEAPED